MPPRGRFGQNCWRRRAFRPNIAVSPRGDRSSWMGRDTGQRQVVTEQVQIDGSDELLFAHKEILHLKEMIAALRDALAEEHSGRQHAVQLAVADANDEAGQLRKTIGALRDELEAMRDQKQRDVQRAMTDSNDEVSQLKQTVGALRDSLEQLRAEKDDAVQSAVTEALAENTHLQETIVKLRDELESAKDRFEEKKPNAARGKKKR